VRALAAVVLAVALAGPAAAQDRMSTAVCEASWDILARTVGWPPDDTRHDPPRATDDGWCGIADLRWTGGVSHEVELTDLRWRLGDPVRLIEDGLPPRSVEVEVGRIATWPEIGNPVRNYAYRLQGPQFEGSGALRLQWDGVAKALTLNEFVMDFGGLGGFGVTARASGVDLADRAAMRRSLGTVTLETLTLEVTATGFLERYLAVPLAEALLDPDGPVPEAQVARLIARAKAALAEVDDDLLPPRSRTALAAALDSLPRPRGTLRVQLQTDAPLPVGEILTDALALTPLRARLDLLRPYLPQMRLAATWTATRGGQ